MACFAAGKNINEEYYASELICFMGSHHEQAPWEAELRSAVSPRQGITSPCCTDHSDQICLSTAFLTSLFTRFGSLRL